MSQTTPRHADTRSGLVIGVVDDLGDEWDQWDGIVASMRVPSPFLRAWWLRGVRDARTRLLVARDAAGRVRGGLPIRSRRVLGVEHVRFAGSGPLCPDHLDLVAAPDDAPAVARALDDWFRRHAPLVLDLEGTVEGAQASTTWGPARPLEAAPFRTLPAPGSYVDGLSASQRYALRRAAKKLGVQGIEHAVVTSADVGGALADFRRLLAGLPGRDHLVAALPQLSRAVEAGHEQGEVRLDVLRGPAQVVAVMISFVTVGRLSLYQVARSTAREAAGAGNVLMHAVFEDAAAEGAIEIDMLRGAERYKYKFVDRTRTLGRLRVGFGRRARAVVLAWDAAERVRRRLRPGAQRLTELSGRIRRLAAP